MYGIFTYIWVILRANVGKYSIHGAYGFMMFMLPHILTPLWLHTAAPNAPIGRPTWKSPPR